MNMDWFAELVPCWLVHVISLVAVLAFTALYARDKRKIRRLTQKNAALKERCETLSGILARLSMEPAAKQRRERK